MVRSQHRNPNYQAFLDSISGQHLTKRQWFDAFAADYQRLKAEAQRRKALAPQKNEDSDLNPLFNE